MRLSITIILTVMSIALMGCDPGAGVTWSNDTDRTVIVYLGDEANREGTQLSPHSSKTEAVIEAVWNDIVVIRDVEGSVLFRQELTWAELEEQDFRFVITEEMISSPAVDTSLLTAEDLASMVLTFGDLSALGDFVLDESNTGVRTTEEIIQDSFDPERDAEELEAYGQVTGYVSSFTKDESQEPVGVFFVSTGVSLFETAEGASLSLDDEVEEASEDIGKSNGSATLIGADVPQVEGLPDDFRALVLTLDVSDDGQADYAITYVAFAIDRLLGAVAIASYDLEADLGSDAAALAETLRGRIMASIEA